MNTLFVSLGAWEKKGLPILVEAVRRLEHAGVDVRLAVAGRPGLGEDHLLHEAADLVARGRLAFLGHCADMAAVYRAADVLVCASHYETCSLALLEALAHGLAIVTAPVHGAAEMVRDGVNGFVVERTPAAFADTLARLSAEPELLQRCRAASREHAGRFHVSAIAAQTRAVYLASRAAPNGT